MISAWWLFAIVPASMVLGVVVLCEVAIIIQRVDEKRFKERVYKGGSL